MSKCAFTLIIILTIVCFRPFRVWSATLARIGVPSPSVSYFPLIVAWKKGFYTQEGFQPEFI